MCLFMSANAPLIIEEEYDIVVDSLQSLCLMSLGCQSCFVNKSTNSCRMHF